MFMFFPNNPNLSLVSFKYVTYASAEYTARGFSVETCINVDRQECEDT